ncbi:MAG TPA: T9SS type A sorting domain-containing protein [bacterium]|nr:T9SS type A sorting domain-containing protein [bacterium]
MKKNSFLLLILFIFMAPLFVLADVTSVQVFNTGTNGKYLQATSVNNPVFHARITADAQGDTLTYVSLYNDKNSWYVGSAGEPASIEPGSVKLWYYPVDQNDFDISTAQYVTHLPVDNDYADWWYNDFSFPVADGSGIWVTIGIAEYPDPGSVEFQGDEITFESGASVSFSGLPLTPPVMLVTQVKPATVLEVSHTGGTMQPFVSTSQQNVIPAEFRFFNASGQGAAPIVISHVTLTVKSYSPFGDMLAPASVMSSIKIQDKHTGTIYGQIPAQSIPSSPVPLRISMSLVNIPADTTTTANIVIDMTGNTASAGINFIISLEDYDSVYAYDYYTYEKVSVHASPYDATGFEMISNFSTIKKQAAFLDARLIDTIPSNINKGQQNVSLLSASFDNPGDTHTAAAETHQFTVYVTDSGGNPLTPSELFSKISITDPAGSVIYGLKDSSSIETSGNSVFFPLLNTIRTASGASTTIVVRADINASTLYNNFRVSVTGPQDLPSRDVNSFAPVAVSITTGTPFISSLALLSSSFLVSSDPLLPAVTFAGQQDIPAMSLNFTSPLSFGSGNIILTGLTITAKNSSGSPVNFNSFASVLKASSGNIEAVSAAPASPYLFLQFPSGVTVTADGTTSAIISLSLAAGASGIYSISVESASHVAAYQDNEPGREIFIAAESGSSFPLESGQSTVSGSSSSLSFSGYPNPFYAGNNLTLAYYLSDNANVTIEIFDLMGRKIRALLSEAPKPKGARSEDTWDGKNDSGRPVKTGTYLVRITASGGVNSSAVRKITILK